MVSLHASVITSLFFSLIFSSHFNGIEIYILLCLDSRDLILQIGIFVSLAKRILLPHALECPAKSKRPLVVSGYKSLAKHLIQFLSLGHIPIAIDIKRIDDGDGLEATTKHGSIYVSLTRQNLTD